MDLLKIINTARHQAKAAKERGLGQVKLSVLSYEDWARIYEQEDNLASREEHRTHQLRNYFFKHFLESEGLEVTMVACRADALLDWAEENGHPLTSKQEKTHVLAHFTHRPDLPPTTCIHNRPLTVGLAGMGMDLYATITAYGESPDNPQILSAAVHNRDGGVVESLDVLAAQHSMEEAFGMISELLAKHGVKNAFQDPEVRRPEFCPDCNELLVNVASEKEYQRLQSD